jgi:hypothetical protein
MAGTDDLVRGEKGGFMGTYQYIVNPLAALPSPICNWRFRHPEALKT